MAETDPARAAVSYLRAIMASEECSPRALRLTEHVIAMNPAHYTVWLYRFKVLSNMGLDVPSEIEWLNEVSLTHLKNYQIWHHRQLLMDHYHPQIAADRDAVRRLARSETAFIRTMLNEDSKNYHVWSYRQYLVGKLGMWDVYEMGATQNLIEEDVRNNSAWSHRFYLVFSDPAHSTPGSLPTQPDKDIPDSVLDREIAYAKEKILLAPQNQSPWNYLRGVLVKGSRPLSGLEEFAGQFVQGLGQEGEEKVTSSHALDLLADIYKERGETDKAKLCLARLGEQWDPVREGYWKYRAAQLNKA
jgi:protein farnesyltransferase/geranylgeranyltransferase type-1 subunit alpha